jgi:hypothetical protein
MENILVKIACVACIVLSLICNVLVHLYKDSQKENELLKGENIILKQEIERRDNDILEISKRKKELEAAIKNDKSNFDWSYNIRNSDPVKQLQKQCLSCSTRAD